MVNLNPDTFCERVLDYHQAGMLTYKGIVPSIVIFYIPGDFMQSMLDAAEAIQQRYEGKMHVFGVNVNDHPGIPAEFKIPTVPMTMFLPVGGGQGAIINGLIPTEAMFDNIASKLFAVPDVPGIDNSGNLGKKLIIPG